MGGVRIGQTEVKRLSGVGCRRRCVKRVLGCWFGLGQLQPGSWSICLFEETKRPGAGLVGRAEDVAGRVYRRCTRAAQEDRSEARRVDWPRSCTDGCGQRFSLASRAGLVRLGRQLEARLVSTLWSTLPHVAQGRSCCCRPSCRDRPHHFSIGRTHPDSPPDVFSHFFIFTLGRL